MLWESSRRGEGTEWISRWIVARKAACRGHLKWLAHNLRDEEYNRGGAAKKSFQMWPSQEPEIQSDPGTLNNRVSGEEGRKRLEREVRIANPQSLMLQTCGLPGWGTVRRVSLPCLRGEIGCGKIIEFLAHIEICYVSSIIVNKWWFPDVCSWGQLHSFSNTHDLLFGTSLPEFFQGWAQIT